MNFFTKKNKNQNKNWLIQAAAFGWAILLFILSSIPYLHGPDFGLPFADKIHHLIAYLIFGLLVSRALYNQNRFPKLKARYLVFSFLICFLYGISDEFHQSFVPGRVSDIFDLMADGTGVIFSMFIFHFRQILFQFLHIL